MQAARLGLHPKSVPSPQPPDRGLAVLHPHTHCLVQLLLQLLHRVFLLGQLLLGRLQMLL